MKIYLAARYQRKDEMAAWGNVLKRFGHEVTSTWIYGGEEGLTRPQIARLDLNDVARAEAVMSFTETAGAAVSRGGRHVEFGYGLALGLKMIIIGEKENVFHELDGIEICPTLDDWIAQQEDAIVGL